MSKKTRRTLVKGGGVPAGYFALTNKTGSLRLTNKDGSLILLGKVA